MKSRIKWLNNQNGYGFTDYLKDKDIFIHYSAINLNGYKSLDEGQIIDCDMIRTGKSFQSKNVKIPNSYFKI